MQKVKNPLTTYPTLRIIDERRPFILYCNASSYTLGSLLSQTDEKGNKYVVYYLSKMLTQWQRQRLSVTVKQCFLLVYAVKYFYNILEDVHFYVP